MTPGPLNLPTIWRGCDWLVVTLDWKDQNGDPIDVTSFTPRAFTRSGYNLNATVTDAINGKTKLTLSAAQTATMKLGVESWDWIWEQSNAPVPFKFPPFLAGTIPVKEPTTKP